MTTEEFSDQFDVILSNYSVITYTGETSQPYKDKLDEYEKSVFLTQALDDFVRGVYSGLNDRRLLFDASEESREAIKPLITNADIKIEYSKEDNLFHTSTEYPKVMFVINASVVTEDGRIIPVVPVAYDLINTIIRNPFKKLNDHKVLQLTTSKGVSLYLDDSFKTQENLLYTVSYIKEPSPIILTDLDADEYNKLTIKNQSKTLNCILPEFTHNDILRHAVELALQSKYLSYKQTTNN